MLALASRVLEFWSVGVELELDWSGGCPIMPLDDKPLQIICIYHPTAMHTSISSVLFLRLLFLFSIFVSHEHYAICHLLSGHLFRRHRKVTDTIASIRSADDQIVSDQCH